MQVNINKANLVGLTWIIRNGHAATWAFWVCFHHSASSLRRQAQSKCSLICSRTQAQESQGSSVTATSFGIIFRACLQFLEFDLFLQEQNWQGCRCGHSINDNYGWFSLCQRTDVFTPTPTGTAHVVSRAAFCSLCPQGGSTVDWEMACV